VREELIIRNYGFINPLSIDASDPRYVSALRIAIAQLEMVRRVLDQEMRLGLSQGRPQASGPARQRVK
jgi:hypothetical protein